MPTEPDFPARVALREVGLRDRLQSIATLVPTERKIEWLREAHAAKYARLVAKAGITLD